MKWYQNSTCRTHVKTIGQCNQRYTVLCPENPEIIQTRLTIYG
ncbi:hypothetical protein JMG10_35525 [Nostoc ellipsosporum NOK]|nr:hypothetical protein [Nostoc ellipsosporum NOK]